MKKLVEGSHAGLFVCGFSRSRFVAISRYCGRSLPMMMMIDDDDVDDDDNGMQSS